MVEKKMKCAECLTALEDDESNDPRLKLLRRKNMGGLKVTSSGVLDICEETDRAINEAQKMDSTVIFKDKFPDILVNTVLRQMGTRVSRLFPQLDDHQLEFQIEDDHVFKLVKTVASCFTRCRMFQFGRDTNESSGDGKVNLRAKLTRTIINYHL